MEFNFNFNFIYAKPNLNSSFLQNNCILIYHYLYFHAENLAKDFYVMVNFLYFILLFLVSKYQLLVIGFFCCCCFYKLFIVYFLVSKGWFAGNQHRIESYENAGLVPFFPFPFFFLFLVQSQIPLDKLDPDPDVVLHISNSPIHVYPS